jgi:hypothetical protein
MTGGGVEPSVDVMTTTASPATGPTTTSSMSRFAPLSGLAFVVLLLVHAAIAVDGLPATDAPAGDVVNYVTDKQGEIQLGAYLQGLGMIAYLWFWASLLHRLRSSERGPARLSLVALTSVTAGIALIGVHISLMTALALRGADVGADVVTFAWVLAFLVLGMGSFTGAAALAAAGILMLRSTLPRWLGVVALVDAALTLVGGMSGVSTAEVWGVVGMVAFLLWLAWLVATSIVLFRSPASDADPR